jgi:hypothetical protein
MKKLSFLFLLLAIFSIEITTAQEKITSPSKGKAVMYFIVTNGSFQYNFKYFDGEKYLGKFNGRKAFRYECDPGKHTFWVKYGNIDFIEAEVKAGAIYLIEAKARMGFVKATVDANDKRQMKRINKIFKKKKLIDLNTYEVTSEVEKIYESQEIIETKKRIKRNLKKIEKKKQRGRKIKKITPDMEYIKQ